RRDPQQDLAVCSGDRAGHRHRYDRRASGSEPPEVQQRPELLALAIQGARQLHASLWRGFLRLAPVDERRALWKNPEYSVAEPGHRDLAGGTGRKLVLRYGRDSGPAIYEEHQPW